MSEEKKDQQIGTDIGGDVDGSLNVAGGNIVTSSTSTTYQQTDTTSVPLVIMGVIGIIAVVAVVALVLVTSGQRNEGQDTTTPATEEAAVVPTIEPTSIATSAEASPLPTMTEVAEEPATTEEATPSVTIAPSAAPTEVFTQTLYDEDFVGWQPQSGAGITGERGSLGGYLIEGAGLLWTGQAADTISGDFELSAAFEVTACDGAQALIGVIFSYDGSSRYIAAGVKCGGEMQVVNQMTAVARSESAGSLDGSLSLESHTLTVRVENGTLTMSVDGISGTPLAASNMQPGRVGLYVDGREGRVEVLYRGLAAVGPSS